MTSPISDFVSAYAERDPLRLHMPGHKGRMTGLFRDVASIDFTEHDKIVIIPNEGATLVVTLIQNIKDEETQTMTLSQQVVDYFAETYKDGSAIATIADCHAPNMFEFRQTARDFVLTPEG